MPVAQKGQPQSGVSVNERLLRLSDDGAAVLVGGRCPKCDHHFFPRRVICPGCGNDELDAVDLSTRGKLWTYTIVHQAPASALVEAPYVIGQVQLPESVLVGGLIKDCAPEQAQIGMDVELVAVKVREDDEGREVFAFAFQPAGKPEE